MEVPLRGHCGDGGATAGGMAVMEVLLRSLHGATAVMAVHVASQISPTFRGRGCTARASNPNGSADMGAVVD